MADGMGVVGGFGVLVGGGTALVGLVSIPNTAFDLGLALRVSGSRTALPDTWDATLGVLVAGVLIAALSWFCSFAWRRAAAAGSLGGKIGTAAVSIGLLAGVAFGLQRLALVMTYGSMLAYYATYPDPDTVKAAMRPGMDVEVLDEAVSRAGQYSNDTVLAVLLDGGADLRQSSQPADRRFCVLAGTKLPFIEVALAHGATPATAGGCEDLVAEVAKFGEDDAESAAIVTRLRGAGWPVPTGDGRPLAEVAAARGFPLTAAALGAP